MWKLDIRIPSEAVGRDEANNRTYKLRSWNAYVFALYLKNTEKQLKACAVENKEPGIREI